MEIWTTLPRKYCKVHRSHERKRMGTKGYTPSNVDKLLRNVGHISKVEPFKQGDISKTVGGYGMEMQLSVYGTWIAFKLFAWSPDDWCGFIISFTLLMSNA